MSARVAYPWFVRRDLDGFFGLLIDNLVQLLLISQFCSLVCGMTGEHRWLITTRILPGAAVSILLGNLFYAWQARRLALKTGRDDVTALPYGINTPSLLIYIFFVIAPEYALTKDPVRAWRMGLIACLGSGLIEFFGSFVAEAIRRRTPRAALLSTLAGISIGFISMGFLFQIFERPLVAMLPLAVLLAALFGRAKFPLGLPGGLLAVLLGTGFAWILQRWSGVNVHVAGVQEAVKSAAFSLPVFCGADIMAILGGAPEAWVKYSSLIIPMGLFNVIGSLQNIESAEASGDQFDTRSSLAANGVGTILAALFGSCFPTTIYIGHPGWKALGSRAGYSVLNGVVITAICLTGAVTVLQSIVPMEAGVAIVLWVGIIITAQAFQATPVPHAPAVAIGLFPAIAAWGYTVTEGAFRLAGGKTIQEVLAAATIDQPAAVNGFWLQGMIVMERGYIFSCMALAAIAALLIDRKFFSAAVWSAIAALIALCGLTHAYQISGNNLDYYLVWSWASTAEGVRVYRGWDIAIGYLLFAAAFVGCGLYARKHPEPAETGH